MKHLFLIFLFVSCTQAHPYKSDIGSYHSTVDITESIEALSICYDMMRSGESDESIDDFLLDTSLNHNIELL